MHNFEQVKDVLDHGRKLHAELRKFYDSLNEHKQQDRVRMVLDYLSRHERNLEEALERFEHDARKGILETWMQYAPSDNVEKILKSCVIKPNMSVDEVVKLATDFDDALVELYKDAAREADEEHVKELFQDLINMENTERQSLARDTTSMLREI
jgi:rubrerythrin